MKKLLSLYFVLLFASIVNAQVATQSAGDFTVGMEDPLTPGESSKLRFGYIYSPTSTDEVWIGRFQNVEPDHTDLRIRLGDNLSGDDRLVIGSIYYEDAKWYTAMCVRNDGKVGIKTENPQKELDVNGTIRAKEILVTATGWADFVFNNDYQLPSLETVENHIKKHKRLPGIPSTSDVEKGGVNLGDMNVKLLQKIEEMTLYIINLEKRMQEMESKQK